MAYRPNSAQGAVYPKCPVCDSDEKALYGVDQLIMDMARDLKALPYGATDQQRQDAIIPSFICGDCATLRDIDISAEVNWPPPSF